MYTAHETILSYNRLTGNNKNLGYPMANEALKLSWYKLFKKTKESVVRKWEFVENGLSQMPCSLENLLGIYVVDDCGDLVALFEDNRKNIDPPLTVKCTCNSCDNSDCMCPSVQDSIVQTDVVIQGNTYTNKIFTRLLKNGNIVEETHTWVPTFNSSSAFVDVQEVVNQVTKCSVEVKSCGCPVNNEANAALLFSCGCIIDSCVPSLKKTYAELYNEIGYYKADYENREVHIFDKHGDVFTSITQVKFVYQSNGSDMLIPDYARPCLISLLDYTKKNYSGLFDVRTIEMAKRYFISEKKEMIKFLNPIPYEWVVEVSDATKRKPHYHGIHSDFIKNEKTITYPTPTVVPDNITNIFNTTQSGGARWLKVVVDGGGSGDPVSGINTYQNAALIGLGNNSSDKVDITLDTQEMQNWGQAASITVNKTLGRITWLNGYILQPGSSLKIDLNQ